MLRRAIIGAFGGDKQKTAGEQFGAQVARAGYILLTGGNSNDADEIKNATMIGATKEATGDPKVVARLIGILPKAKEKKDECDLLPRAPRTTCLLLRTVLSSEERNVINGITPDVAVIFGGGLGTVAEAAFAKAANKELIFYNGVDLKEKKGLDRLEGHLQEFDRDENIEKYFRTPLSRYPGVLPIDKSKLLKETPGKLLKEMFDAAKTATDIAELVLEVKKLVAKIANVSKEEAENVMLALSTGFPGLPKAKDLVASKNKFDEIVVQISSSDYPELFCTTL